MSNLKLGVAVESAHNLLPKDGKGSSNPYVELHFDHQKYRTTIKEKDLNPYWNETFLFNISDPHNSSNLTLDTFVYNNIKGSNFRSFLGKVHINGTSFVPYSDAVVLHYPLEKRGIFSRVSGELGLKVFITDNPTIRSSNPLPEMEHSYNTTSRLAQGQSQTPVQQVSDYVPDVYESRGSRHTFNHLPNPNNPQQKPQFSTTEQPGAYGVEQMRANPQAPKIVCMYSGSSSQPLEYALKETSPFLGGGQVVGTVYF